MDLVTIIPEIFLSITIFLIVIINLILKNKKIIFYITIICLLIIISIITYTLCYTNCNYILSFNKMIKYNTYTNMSKLFLNFATFIVLLFIKYFNKYYKEDKLLNYIILLLTNLIGCCIAISSNNIIMIYISIEIISCILYLLLSDNNSSLKISLHYCIYGLFISALMLYGMSYIYYITGNFILTDICFKILDKYSIAIYKFGIYLFISGILFKLGAFPFNLWVIDVYNSIDYDIIILLSVIIKYTNIIVLYNIFCMILSYNMSDYSININLNNVLIILSIITMTLGNIKALYQYNIKKMLGYISIGQTGLFLTMLLSFNNYIIDIKFFIYYIIINSLLNLIFIIYIYLIYNEFFPKEKIHYKLNIYILLIVIFNIIGLPPTIGFFIKIIPFINLMYISANVYDMMTIILLLSFIINNIIITVLYLNILKKIIYKCKTI